MAVVFEDSAVRKHRAPKGALRLIFLEEGVVGVGEAPESTECQKVH